MSQSVKSPISILQRAVRKHVSIMLKDGAEYRGRIVNVGSYMNIVLRDAAEYDFDRLTANYGRIVIRGSKILLVKLQDEPEQDLVGGIYLLSGRLAIIFRCRNLHTNSRQAGAAVVFRQHMFTTEVFSTVSTHM